MKRRDAFLFTLLTGGIAIGVLFIMTRLTG